MIFKKVNELLVKTTNEIVRMDTEREEMKCKNKINSTKIRDSVQLKSEQFQTRRKERNDMFNIIRNK